MADYKLVLEKDAQKEMKQIGVDKRGMPHMLPKSRFRLIKLFDVRNAVANIMKEEMLSLGGDVAKNKGCVGCVVEKSDLLVMGTIKQISGLIKKMKRNVAECPDVAKVLEAAVKDTKTFK